VRGGCRHTGERIVAQLGGHGVSQCGTVHWGVEREPEFGD
jgi:hypothetical protein